MASPKNARAEHKNSKAQQLQPTSGTETTPSEQLDAVSLIKEDHRTVENLFAQFASAGLDEEKQKLAKRICNDLIVHAMIEEELFYAACRDAGVQDDVLDEAQVEHDGAKILINDVMSGSPQDEFYDAKVKVLSEYIKSHVAEEEEPNDGILAKAQKAGINMTELGQRLQARRAELSREADRGELPPPTPRSLQYLPGKRGQQKEDSKMMDRYSRTPDRDEHGRFVSDDHDGHERYFRSDRDYGDDRRYARPRDDMGRFESYDDGRHSHSREYDDHDERRSRGSRRGWSGDPEGHSEASRRGWEGRRSEDHEDRRYRYREEDDHGRYRSHEHESYDDHRGARGRPTGWSGDPEGHSEASRRGWEGRRSDYGERHRRHYRDDDDDGRSHGGGRGWYGDSEGHAEAARRGWEERGSHRRSSRDRWDDDDDDRRPSRGPGEGHGGWYGDHRGHAEAARRGWQNRDR